MNVMSTRWEEVVRFLIQRRNVLAYGSMDKRSGIRRSSTND